MPDQTNNLSSELNQYFDDASFKTLYGGVLVTWVSTSAIADVFSVSNLKLLGFIIAIVVALVGYFVSEKRTVKKLVIAPFNGLLIYLTIMGGTSFLPNSSRHTEIESSPIAAARDSVSNKPESVDQETKAKPATHFLMSWNAQKSDPKIVQKASQLSEENKKLQLKTNTLQQQNKVYKTKLDSTKQAIQKLNISPQVQKNLLNNLQFENHLQLHSVN